MATWTVRLKTELASVVVEADYFRLEDGAWYAERERIASPATEHRGATTIREMAAAFSAEQVVSIVRRTEPDEQTRAVWCAALSAFAEAYRQMGQGSTG